MIEQLRSPEVQRFVLEHEHADASEILLKYKTINGVPAKLIADQITGRRKAREKIPLYYRTQGIIYPPGKNLEQSSSEQTAFFKAQLQNELPDLKSCVDLTGGFGVDSYFLSRVFEKVTMVEVNNELISIATANHQLLGAHNIIPVNKSATDFLNDSHDEYSMIYIDPSRRDQTNKKVYTLRESEPDVVSLIDILFRHTSYILVKASPLLDIHLALSDIDCVRKVFVVSVDNECKELLFFLVKTTVDEPQIEAVNLTKNKMSRFEFTFSEERNVTVRCAGPKTYLYEPNASLLKAGAFKLIGDRFGLHKLHPNTHLYSSDELLSDFPGKAFKIIADVKPDSRSVNEFLPDGKANITVRNYSMSPSQLKIATKLKDGGDRFLIGFTSVVRKHLVVAVRLY